MAHRPRRADQRHLQRPRQLEQRHPLGALGMVARPARPGHGPERQILQVRPGRGEEAAGRRRLPGRPEGRHDLHARLRPDLRPAGRADAAQLKKSSASRRPSRCRSTRPTSAPRSSGQFDGGNTMVFGLETPFTEPHDFLFNMYHPKGTRNHAGVNDPEADRDDREADARRSTGPSARSRSSRSSATSAEQMYYPPNAAGMRSAGLAAERPRRLSALRLRHRRGDRPEALARQVERVPGASERRVGRAGSARCSLAALTVAAEERCTSTSLDGSCWSSRRCSG